MKTCKKCGISKPLEDFSLDKRNLSGVGANCKSCDKVRLYEYSRSEQGLEKSKQYREANKEKIRLRSVKWRQENIELVRKNNLEWQKNNPEKHGAACARSYAKDPKKSNDRGKKWRQENPEKVRSFSAKRRASELKRTPTWANLKKIEEVYINCPEGLDVDHIIPLQGKNVSGLHVDYNLQYLNRHDNISKNNRFDPHTFYYENDEIVGISL